MCDESCNETDGGSIGGFPSNESEARTFDAIRKTSRALDGIILDLNKETSRTARSLLVDNSDSGSDDGEHGEKELRQELDSIQLPPLRQEKTPSRKLAPQGAISSKMLATDSRAQEESMSQQPVEVVEQAGTEYPETAPVCSEELEDKAEDIESDASLPPSKAGALKENCQNAEDEYKSGISVDSTQTPGSNQDSRDDPREVPLHILRTSPSQRESIFSKTKTTKYMCLQFCCALLTLAVLACTAGIVLTIAGNKKKAKVPAHAAASKRPTFSATAPTLSPTIVDLLGLETTQMPITRNQTSPPTPNATAVPINAASSMPTELSSALNASTPTGLLLPPNMGPHRTRKRQLRGR